MRAGEGHSPSPVPCPARNAVIPRSEATWESVPPSLSLVKSPKTTHPDLSKTQKCKNSSEKPCIPLALVL